MHIIINQNAECGIKHLYDDKIVESLMLHCSLPVVTEIHTAIAW